tara:strand:- start:2476 stop:3288 length:813 start_codon:yes stop_codon:yes gene_type:complete
MDLTDLLALKPGGLAATILERRKFLAGALPDIEVRMSEDVDILAPAVEKLRLARDAGSNRVAELKNRRNEAQREARELLQQTRVLRGQLEESEGLKNLDPKWAKEKLEEALQDIEDKIDTHALSLIDERRLIAERKALLQRNAAWLDQRRKDNPEMAMYAESSRKMQKLFTLADKLHQEMLTHVEKNEPVHAKFVEMNADLRNSIRQLERSRALIKQSEAAISFWENTIQDGFETLLTSATQVEAGGKSTILRRNAELPIATKPDRGEEE